MVFGVGSASGAIQFDVFLGYGSQPTGTDGAVPETGWFSVGCEVFNDGPSFDAVFELTPAQFGRGQSRRFAFELPTNTRKRFTLPAYLGTGNYSVWDARLLDAQGKVRAERTGLRPLSVAWESVLFGAVPRTFGGLPRFPELAGGNARSPLQPQVARLQVEQLPDNPIALEGLDALYLNSEKALELKVNQAAAVVAWVYAGGHLIVGVEQPGDVEATPWLRTLLPCELGEVVTRRGEADLLPWLQAFQGRSLGTTELTEAGGGVPGPRGAVTLPPDVARRYGVSPGLRDVPGRGPSPPPLANPYAKLSADPEFGEAEFLVAAAKLRDGQVVLSAQGTPLIVSAPRGHGRVSVLAFSPEREPFRSWKNREWFWARLLELPPAWFAAPPAHVYGGWSIDGVFGAMIDSRQVRKLPVRWLLLLLLVYLVVIGPLDQYWLKRINRQMLTWLTFPAYVVFFSLLIYYIGYRLRAGETEWNELHVVDVLPRGDQAELRGRTYMSIYSPVNARYRLASELPYATLRGEALGAWGGGQEASRAEVAHAGAGFRAEVFVPVWTSQLYVSDWYQAGTPPLRASVLPQGPYLRVRVDNQLNRPLQQVCLVLQDRLYELGELRANGAATFTVEQPQGALLRQFVHQRATQYQAAVGQRQRAFGDNQVRWLELSPANLTAVSFIAQLPGFGPNQRGFTYPRGLELTALLARGDAVLLAWDPGHAPVPSMKQFQSVRSRQNTWLRLALPVGQAGAL
jgi:hypothetical protein